MKADRVIKLPVFRTMFTPVARKAWKCSLCKTPVEIGDRYVHYIDRRAHEIVNYRFHKTCFNMVEAYCIMTKSTSFTPSKVRNWVKKAYCEDENCAVFPCKKLESVMSVILKKFKNDT